MLAVGDRQEDELPCLIIAAEQLDDDVHLGIADQRTRIIGDATLAGGQPVRPFQVAIGDDADPDRASGAPRNLFGVSLEHRVDATTDGTDTEKSNVDRFHWAKKGKIGDR